MVKDMCVQTMPENIFAKPMTECVSNEAAMVTTASGPGPSNVSNNDSNFVECPMDFDGNDIIGYSPAWKFDILPDGTFKTSTIYDPLRDGHVPLVAREVSVTDGPLILLVGDEEGQVHYNHKDRVQMDIGNSTLHVLDPTEEAVLLVNEKVPLDLNELIVNTPIGQESQGSQTDEHADVENSYSNSNSNSSGDQKKSRIAFEQLDIELPTDKKYLKQTII
ncbi:uncharacterized protein LOC111072773 [Drosophila obscura]|uniref:uncharacterized protein LOC111072773 n=1 Tax=Drosophila obscura TaxID=7282 RepID=UPI001BB2C585|nr:uncharacterized protein LOC111072773 [Drosophila obscura]